MNEIRPSPVMTLQEVAHYLQVSVSTIYKLAQLGELPGRKVGGRWRFARRSVEEWLINSPQADQAPGLMPEP